MVTQVHIEKQYQGGGGGGGGGCSLEGDGAAAGASLASRSNVRSLLASLRLSVASKKSAENHDSGNDGNEDPNRATSGG